MTRPLELILTGLSLAGDRANRPKSGFWIELLGDDIDFGTPGEDGTRQVGFTAVVCGYTTDDLRDGERVLAQVAHTDTPGRLEWLPAESGPRTLYWVKSSRMVAQFNDLSAQRSVKELACRVTLTCDRYAYPETIITETFTPGTTTITVTDACSANTNWPGTTAVTYLGESAVRLGPITAAAGSSFIYDLPGWRYGTISTGYIAAGTFTFNGSVSTSTNYMFVDFAFTSTAPTAQADAPQIVGVTGPIAQQPTPSKPGYTRYFYPRKAGALQIKVYAQNLNAGDTATFYTEGIGASTSLPSGSVFVLNTKAAVTSKANLRINRSSNGLGETIVYADPSMLTHGWDPATGASWANAPEGDYWVYIELSSFSAGDVFSMTIGGISATNRMDASSGGETRWMPFGPFHFSGKKSRRLGTVSGLGSTTLFKNGVSQGSVTTMRLFRKHPDAVLNHAWLDTASAGNTVFIEPESIDAEHPGVFAGTDTTGSDATTVAWPSLRAWGEVPLIPPTTALFVQCDATTTPVVVVNHRPPGHTFAAEF